MKMKTAIRNCDILNLKLVRANIEFQTIDRLILMNSGGHQILDVWQYYFQFD